MTHQQEMKLRELSGDTTEQFDSNFYLALFEALEDRNVENVEAPIDDQVWEDALESITC